jgi:hypothetical protein
MLQRANGHHWALDAFKKEQKTHLHKKAISEDNAGVGRNGIRGITYNAAQWKVSREFIDQNFEAGHKRMWWYGLGLRILGGAAVGGLAGTAMYKGGFLPSAWPTWGGGRTSGKFVPTDIPGKGPSAPVQPTGPRNIGTIQRPVWQIVNPGDVRFIVDCSGFQGNGSGAGRVVDALNTSFRGFPQGANYLTVEHAFRGLFKSLNGVEISSNSRTAGVLDRVLRETFFDSKQDLEKLIGYIPQGGPRMTDGVRDFEWVTRNLQGGQRINFNALRGEYIDEMIARARRMSGSDQAVALLQELKANIRGRTGLNLTTQINRY